MNSFAEFCAKFCNQVPMTIQDVPLESSELDTDISKRMHTLISNVRLQKNRFHQVPMHFITNRLADLDEVRKCLDSYHDGDVPDEILESLSMELYEYPFNNLRVEYQNIIETLAVYIVVSHVRDSINK